ncbi:MAG: hypothetical protein H6918_09625 [Sphingomonadaceae bacterium]|nr:hypothetical protein [Sphingomonadaceae bacterium]
MPREIRIAFAALGMIAAAGAALPTEAQAQSSRYRQVSDGVGNCIFSTGELSYRNDDAPGYRMQTASFSASQPVHVRCYFPSALVNFASMGKAYNTLRSNQTYNMELVAHLPGGEELLISKIGGGYDRPDRDQVRLDLIRSGDCDFALDPAQAGRWSLSIRKQGKATKFCPDMQVITAALQRQHGAAPIRYCVQAYVPWSDETRTIRTEIRGRIEYQRRPTNVQRKYVAQGCFTYDAG